MPVPGSISVVIPCYNSEQFLVETLESVARQSRQPDEVLVVDDASTDGSAALARKLGATVVSLAVNRGLPGARNAGIDAATGEFVALLDADDVWGPRHLETVVPLLEQNPDAGLAFGLLKSFGKADDVQPLAIPPNQAVDVFAQIYGGENVCLPSGTIVRRSASLAIGNFDEKRRDGEDYDFCLRMAREYKFVGSPEITGGYRKLFTGLSMRKAQTRTSNFDARNRFWREAVAAGSSEAGWFEEGMRTALLNRLREAWDHRNSEMMGIYLDLAPKFVPGSEGIEKQYRRKRRLIPLLRLYDRLPAPLTQLVRRVGRKIISR
jgi:glycosyltransferase involved in cell wall biosynthesis